MKIFVYLLSLYILVLSATPCVDASKDNVLLKIELSNDTTEKHQNDFDYCSPFCTSNCCAISFVYQESIFDFNSFLFPQKHLSEYKSSNNPLPYHTIWQPPKIS